MANYATLISAIQSVITENGNNEITGPILQQTLVSIINALGSGYQFIGIATPSTTPGTPDQKVFYIGASGTYPNFGPAVIPDGNLAVFYYDSSWHYGTVAFPLGDGSVTTSKLADNSVTINKLAPAPNSGTSADLDVADSAGNVLARFENGHFRVKNFDSEKNNANLGVDSIAEFSTSVSYSIGDITKRNGLLYRFIRDHAPGSWNNADVEQTNVMQSATHPVSVIDSSNNSDFEISDLSGNVLARFKNGHFRVKKFDSSFGRNDYKRQTRFTVNAECGITVNPDFVTPTGINEYTGKKYYSDIGVLYLPNSYSVDGEPTKLIIFCKQGGSQVTEQSDPIFDLRIFNYMLYLGYAVVAVDGMPDGLTAELGLDDTRVVGNYVAVQCAKKAYDYVVTHFNIDKKGAYIFGYSQGGHFAQNVVDLSGIPLLAAAELSPVCSMRYHQWDLDASKTIGGVTFTRAARLNIARLFKFNAISTNSQLLALEYDQQKVQGYDPWTRNVENPFLGFTQSSSYGSNLWALPSGMSIDEITMKKRVNCPIKIWCAENDAKLGVDVMKVFIKAIRNSGCVGNMHLFSTGGHQLYNAQTAIGTFIENGVSYNLYPLAVEIAIWFSQFGGYDVIY